LEIEVLCSSKKLRALVDNGSSHCFIHPRVVGELGLEMGPRVDLVVELANGSRQWVSKVSSKLGFTIGSMSLEWVFNELPIGNFDLILGMDWLREVRAKILCVDRKLVCYDSNDDSHEVEGLKSSLKYKIMSSDRFVKLDRRDKGLVFALYLNTPKDGANVIGEDDFLVLQEFKDVFPETLPRLPPFRGIDHVINLSHDTKLIAIPPY
jgi:hypothetical protein